MVLSSTGLTASGGTDETLAGLMEFFTGSVETETGAAFAKDVRNPVIELVIGDDYRDITQKIEK